MNETAGKKQRAASDIAATGWLHNALPPSWRPYARLARLDRPIGTWLLLLPGWWSIALAAASDQAFSLGAPHQAGALAALFALFGVGAMAMRGAGCVWNDITDRDVDGCVARTATRPLPSGEITPKQALFFMALLLLAGASILVPLPALAQGIALAALALVAFYPYMKRITYWPQAWLGLTFNWGGLVGWAAFRGTLEAPALLLYSAGFFWTLAYDTIYAHQDKADDALIGLKSTALRLGAATRPWVAAFFVIALVLLGAAAVAADLPAPCWVFLAAAAGHAGWQVVRLDIDDPARCLSLFRANRDFGLLTLAAFLSGLFL